MGVGARQSIPSSHTLASNTPLRASLAGKNRVGPKFPWLEAQNRTASSLLTFDLNSIGIAVGGDYFKPEDSTRTTAFNTDGGKLGPQPPHRFRATALP
jgi:hypothetical protein